MLPPGSPSYVAQHVANELRLQGVNVSPSGVRGVWQRHDLLTRHKRLMRLERQEQDTTFVLNDQQIRLLERHSRDSRMRHIEANRAGELLNQDTFYWGTLKGVGKVYIQVVVDVFCSLALAKVYTSRMPITAADTYTNACCRSTSRSVSLSVPCRRITAASSAG